MTDPNEEPRDDMAGGLRAAFGDEPAADRPSVLRLLQERSNSKLDLYLHDEGETEEHAVPVTIDDESKALRDPTGRYQVLGEIGRGGVGVVYKGRDQDLGRDVAMKLLRPEYANRPEILERFVEEAQIGGQLQHPGIVPVYDLGLQHGERPYFAMKLVKGETLDAILQRRQGPEEERRRLLGIFEQVCQTVAYAHARRVVHRDLKPQNVMVGSFGEVQIVDWGFAKVLPKSSKPEHERSAERLSSVASVISTVRSDPDKGTHSVVGSMLGTPAYMPPEQAIGDVDHMDRCSDVFGLGAILCEILTGSPPYLKADGDLIQQAARADLEATYERIDASGADPAIARLCRQCLSPARQARPESARQVAEAVGEFLSSVEERARQAQIHAAEAKVRARAAVWLSAAAILVLGLGCGGWFYLDGEARAQSERADRRVASVMEDAGVRFGMARAASAVDLSLWTRALDAADRAVELAQADEVTASKRQAAVELRQRIDAGHAEARAEATRLAKADRIRVRLREARVPVDDNVKSKTYRAREAKRRCEAYRAAFREYLDGRELRKMTATAGAAALAGDLDVEIAAALDDWVASRVFLARNSKTAELDAKVTAVLRGVATALDPDPMRSRVRSAVAGDAPDKSTLLEIFAQADLQALPVASLSLLGGALADVQAEDEARTVYEVAAERFPGDFGSAFELAFLHERAEEWREALAGFKVAGAVHPEMLEVWHRAGHAMHQLGRYEAAERVFRRLVRQDADNTHWQYHLAATLTRLEQYPEARSLLERAVSLSPDIAVNHDELARVLRELGELERAEHHQRRAIDLDPSQAHQHVGLGLVLQQQGKLDEALAAYQKALEVDPDSVWAWSNWGNILQVRGKLEQAEEKQRRALAIDPRFGMGYNNLGDILLAQGEVDEALAAYQRAIDLEPGESLPYTGMSRCLARLGRRQEALEVAKRALALDPELPNAHSELGSRSFESGEYEQAIASYRRAIQLETRPTERWGLHYNLGLAQSRSGRYAEAVDSFRSALAFHGDETIIQVQLGHALLNSGEIDAAFESLTRSIELDDGVAMAHYDLAVIHAQRSELSEAEGAVRRALALESATASWDLLGRVLIRMGDHDEAIECYQKAVELDPDFASAHYSIGYLLGSQGRMEAALAALRRAEAIDERTGRLNARERAAVQRLIADAEVALKATADLLEKVRSGADVSDPNLLVQAAWLLYQNDEYLLATRTYARALKRSPELQAIYPHRYNEACSAVLAASGKGEGAATLTDQERAELRNRARTALAAELERWRETIEADGAPAQVAQKEVEHALRDPAFVSLRSGALESLDAGDAAAWRSLWESLATLAKEQAN